MHLLNYQLLTKCRITKKYIPFILNFGLLKEKCIRIQEGYSPKCKYKNDFINNDWFEVWPRNQTSCHIYIHVLDCKDISQVFLEEKTTIAQEL